MATADTIAAISSAVGPAARMIVRMSGDRARDIAQSLCEHARLEHASASRETIRFAGLLFPIWLYAFHRPRSYTGEDLIEFHLPGNPLLARMVLDLAAAEGVAAVISAQNDEELQAARQLLAGELARRLRPLMDGLAQTLALVETGIDFSDEDVTFITAQQLDGRIAEVDDALADLVTTTARFERLAHEPQVVLVGRPNAGKSTLLNALAGRDRAVVSPTAGTTRDVVSADVRLARGIVKLLDVAGIEASSEPAAAGPAGEIARQMRLRALQMVETSDLVVLVRDPTDPARPPDLPRRPDLIVQSKLDLDGRAAGDDAISISARTGANVDALRARLDVLAFGDAAHRPSLALNARHLAAIADARAALDRARAGVHAGAEIVAFDLREALDALGTILGHVSPDDVLGQVFSTFCIGK